MWDIIGALAPWIAMAILYLLVLRVHGISDARDEHATGCASGAPRVAPGNPQAGYRGDPAPAPPLPHRPMTGNAPDAGSSARP